MPHTPLLHTPEKLAKHFLENETAFRLGMLPTENSHPKTENFSRIIAENMNAGVESLLEVDRDIPPLVPRAMECDQFDYLASSFVQSILSQRRIFFTGCGETGRLAVLMETMWRRFWEQVLDEMPGVVDEFPGIQNVVSSIIAGGDHALVRSVDAFEDSMDLGRSQLAEAGVRHGDTVVALSESGETPFVIGTAWQGVNVGASTFFVYNNPTDVLREHVERARNLIDSHAVCKIELFTGPMAIAGSTRMQATTTELLMIGAAMEHALHELLCHHMTPAELRRWHLAERSSEAYADHFSKLLDDLAGKPNVECLAQIAEWEANIYQNDGLVTYMADECLLDILTDTVERSPIFQLPPFRKCDDTTSEVSWAFVKHPCFPTTGAWKDMLLRSPRGLDWPEQIYRDLGITEASLPKVPDLTAEALMKYCIGNEPDSSRLMGMKGAASNDAESDVAESGLVMVVTGREIIQQNSRQEKFDTVFADHSKDYRRTAAICVGMPPEESEPDWDPMLVPIIPDFDVQNMFYLDCNLAGSPIGLWDHLAVKLVLNVVSTAAMARLGRIEGNLMVHIESSNKKLIDRSTRQVMHLADVDYETACVAVHRAMHASQKVRRNLLDVVPPVMVAVQALGEKSA